MRTLVSSWATDGIYSRPTKVLDLVRWIYYYYRYHYHYAFDVYY